MKQNSIWCILFINSILISFTTCFAQHAFFQGLGDFPGGSFESGASAVSADGSVVVGYGTTAAGQQAFRWTKNTGMVSLGKLPDSSFKKNWANSISADGTVIVGSGDPGSGWDSYKGFRWTQDSGMVLIGSLDGSARYEAWGVSANGSVIVGDGGLQGFRWTKSGGIEGIGVLPGRNRGRAVAVSADGSVAVGSSYTVSWDQEQAFRWTKAEGIVGLGFLSGSNYSFPNAVSPDGSVIVGTSSASSGYPAFRWSQATGMVNIGHLLGKQTTHPFCVSLNGKIIIGGSFNSPTDGRAFIWDSTHGMRDLQNELQSNYGLNLTGWQLHSAFSITPNGNVIVGSATNPAGNQEAFRVVLDTVMDYLGQTPPGDTAKIFAPGIISLSNRMEGSLVFTPGGSECYFGIYEYINGDFLKKIYYTKRVNNTWSNMEEAAFSIGQNVTLSSVSLDGNRLFFEKGGDLWKVERMIEGWSEPQRLPAPINSTSTESSYTESADGTIYFDSDRPGGFSQYYDIWRLRPSSVQAENLGPIVNSGITQATPCIAPDGSYLIFSQLINERPSLVISFKKGNDGWTAPLDMDRSGAGINILNQVCPILSPDGKYLFFNRHTGYPITNIADVYWVSTHIIVGLKKTAYAPKLINQITPKRLQADTIYNYVIPSNTFSCEYSIDSLHYSASLSNGSALPSWLHFDSDTRTLWGTPIQAGVDTIKITATNKDTVSTSCSFRITVTSSTGVEEEKSQLPKETHLYQNYPNPFNPSTVISYQLSVSSNVKLSIYNLLGQKIKTLVNSFQSAGEHSITWDAMNETNNPMSSGMYFYRLETDNQALQMKMLLIR
jgi:probable HAF family extracellular repeat protein